MKMCLVGGEFRADRETDRRTDMTKLIVAYPQFPERTWQLWETIFILLFSDYNREIFCSKVLKIRNPNMQFVSTSNYFI
jgi:hypothetical protein